MEPSAPGGLTARQAQNLLVLHDAAYRRDYRTLRRHMAHDFTHNGVTVRPEGWSMSGNALRRRRNPCAGRGPKPVPGSSRTGRRT